MRGSKGRNRPLRAQRVTIRCSKDLLRPIEGTRSEDQRSPASNRGRSASRSKDHRTACILQSASGSKDQRIVCIQLRARHVTILRSNDRRSPTEGPARHVPSIKGSSGSKKTASRSEDQRIPGVQKRAQRVKIRGSKDRLHPIKGAARHVPESKDRLRPIEGVTIL